MALHKIKFGNVHLAGIVINSNLPNDKVHVRTSQMEFEVSAADLVDVYPEGSFNDLESRLFNGYHSQILSNKQFYIGEDEPKK